MSPPPIKVRGAGRAKGIPQGYVLGRSSQGNGDVELLDLAGLRRMGVARSSDVGQAVSAAQNFGFAYDRPINSITPSAALRDVDAGVAWTILAAPTFGSHQARIDGAGPTVATTFLIKVAGVTVGSFTFAIGATSATFTIAADAPVAVNETVTIVAPASLNGMTGTLYGTVLGQRT
jgi:hypothetical protein